MFETELPLCRHLARHGDTFLLYSPGAAEIPMFGVAGPAEHLFEGLDL